MALTVSATDTEVQKPVNVIYNQMLLRNARPLAPYFVGTMPGSIQKNGGTATIKWRRYNTSADNASGIAPTTTPLSELTGVASYMQGRDSSTVHFTDVTATVAKYGQFFILNEEVDVFLPNGTMAGITNTLAISAGRSLNQLQRDQVEDNATLVYAGNAASDAAVVDKMKLGAIESVVNTLGRNSALPFTPMSNGSTIEGSTPILPGYWGLCHTDVAYDIEKLATFVPVSKYAQHTATVPGEFGLVPSAGQAVRFISTPEASIDSDAGGTKGSTGLRGTSDVDLYTTVIYGQDAVGSVGLGRRHGDGIYRGGDNLPAFEIIAKGIGTNRPSGTDDPFDEIMTIAWKSWWAGALLNGNWVRGIRHGATDISNLL
jgi:N4-gp56 family major capsid protein